jgi:hypothetical protein
MPRKQPSESPSKGEESVSGAPSGMERFERLARGVLGVHPEELAEQERLYKASRPIRPKSADPS